MSNDKKRKSYILVKNDIKKTLFENDPHLREIPSAVETIVINGMAYLRTLAKERKGEGDYFDFQQKRDYEEWRKNMRGRDPLEIEKFINENPGPYKEEDTFKPDC